VLSMTRFLTEPDGLRYNGGALAYAVIGYAVGFAGLFHGNWAINLAAIVLMAHAMTISAYLIHECAHNLVFRNARHNARLGRFLAWLCGAAYGTFEDMRYKHFRHHVDVADVAWFDYERFFAEHPYILKVTRFLEWFYIPAHELIMHTIMAFTSFIIPERRTQRRRNVTVLLIRGGAFAALIIYFPRVALLYAIAYMLMVTILRFMDSIQHDYGYSLTLFQPGVAPRKGDYEWEQVHTFSNPHLFTDSVLNWITLNFGFHNAHHADMMTPWYRLPAKHRELFGDDPAKVIPLWPQLKIFHKQRVRRIVGNHIGNEPYGHDYLIAARNAQVTGGNAASFLTAF
jgi:acyl-lipid omega-6 desaturase (Delta-12 desaturase)